MCRSCTSSTTSIRVVSTSLQSTSRTEPTEILQAPSPPISIPPILVADDVAAGEVAVVDAIDIVILVTPDMVILMRT